MKKKQTGLGFTLLELLLTIAVFIIILTIIIINFTSSNRMSELRLATDRLADDIRGLQNLAMSNIKITEYPDIERGYSYLFDLTTPNSFSSTEITSAAEDSPIDEYFYNDWELNKSFYYPKINLIKMITYESSGMIWPSQMRINFLFPDGDNQIIDPNQSGSCGNYCVDLELYIKHSDLGDWQGKVTLNRFSGKITSEVIPFP